MSKTQYPETLGESKFFALATGDSVLDSTFLFFSSGLPRSRMTCIKLSM